MAESGRAAVRLALRQGEATLLGGFDLDSLTAQDVWETALTGDAVAQRVVQITGERLGEVAALLVDLLNPDCIVVGGLAVYMGDALLGPARRVMGREALRGAAEVCQIVPAALGRKIGDVAALCVALNLGNGLNTRKLQGSLTQ
jgi:glucokinase